MNDIKTPSIEEEIILCYSDPDKYIEVVVTHPFVFFEEVIDNKLDKQIAEMMSFPGTIGEWASDYVDNLKDFIKAFTPSFVSEVNPEKIINSDNQMWQGLLYQLLVIKSTFLFNNETIVDKMKPGLEESLKKVEEKFNKM